MAKPSRPSDPQNVKAKFRTFFVTTRTAESRPILQTDRMAALFVEVLRCYMRAGRFRVHEFVNPEPSGSHIAAKHLNKKCGHSIRLQYRSAFCCPGGDEKGAELSLHVLRIRWTGWFCHRRGLKPSSILFRFGTTEVVP